MEQKWLLSFDVSYLCLVKTPSQELPHRCQPLP